jgi:flagellar basal-body rod modification protein FlgD
MSTSALSGLVQGQAVQQTPNTVAEPDAFNKLDLGQFIKLLVAEMQNQDPMNPMDNSEILQTISQIKAIASNDKMTNTLSAMQLQQNMASAGMLLNQTVKGLSDNGDTIVGKIDKVSVAGGKVQLHIGDETLDLKNIAEIDGNAVQLEQNLASGNSLMNRIIKGLNAAGGLVTGKVNKISVEDNQVQLHVGAEKLDMRNVTEIDDAP